MGNWKNINSKASSIAAALWLIPQNRQLNNQDHIIYLSIFLSER